MKIGRRRGRRGVAQYRRAGGDVRVGPQHAPRAERANAVVVWGPARETAELIDADLLVRRRDLGEAARGIEALLDPIAEHLLVVIDPLELDGAAGEGVCLEGRGREGGAHAARPERKDTREGSEPEGGEPLRPRGFHFVVFSRTPRIETARHQDGRYGLEARTRRSRGDVRMAWPAGLGAENAPAFALATSARKAAQRGFAHDSCSRRLGVPVSTREVWMSRASQYWCACDGWC